MGVPLQIAAAVLGLVLVVVVLTRSRRSRARATQELAAAQAETALLRERLVALEERAETLERDSTELSRRISDEQVPFLITDAGVERPEPNIPDRVVLSATLGEPLVKVAALGHGLARALSPESRNRIWFEMKREVRRARKQRRRETKEAWRQMRAEDRKAA